MKIYIMRGIVGAGKSSWLRANGVTEFCSADLSHMTNGVYKFDPAKKEQAHNTSLSDYLNALRGNFTYEIPYNYGVDNTNLTAWELAPYVRLAEIHKVNYEIIRIEVDPFKAVRNVHQVPLERVFQMYQTLREERLPPWWKERVVLADSFAMSCKAEEYE